MKKRTLLLAGMAMATICATAQTADEIINKYADAIGGKKKLAGIKSVYMEGDADANGQKIPIKIWTVVGKSERTEFTFNGMTGYTIIRSDSGWAFSPFAGQTHAEPMTADQVKSASTELDYPGGQLINYKEKGFVVTSQGKDDVDGTEAYKLEEKVSDSLTKTYYLDPETYYVIRVHEKATVNGKVEEVDQDYTNYQKTPEGFMFAMSISGGVAGGGVKFTTIKINSDIDTKLFSPANK
jgi:hypothetical protein